MTAGDAVGRNERLQPVVGVVAGNPGDGADLAQGARIDQLLDALADGEPPAVVLPPDLVWPAHGAGQALALSQLFELRLPALVIAAGAIVVGHARALPGAASARPVRPRDRRGTLLDARTQSQMHS
jgi:hypothetical protein